MVFKPEEMTILVDTREQRPFCFDFENASFKTREATLDTGDYSVAGMMHLVAIERKSISDLVSCIGPERARFERELKRLEAFDCSALIVEGSWTQIKMKQYRSKTHPNSVIGSLCAWIARHQVPVIMAENARIGAEITAKIMYQYVKSRVSEIAHLIPKK